jgi:hypothetical protein
MVTQPFPELPKLAILFFHGFDSSRNGYATVGILQPSQPMD